MSVLFKNNVTATLASAITSSATSISLTAGQGSRFPSPSTGDYFYATLYDSSNNLEIIKVTNRATDILTVVRAQDNSTARAYNSGDSLAIRITAAGLTDLVSYTPQGNLSATTLANAVTELDGEKAGLALNNTFSGNNTFNNNVTLSGGATGDLTGNVTGNLTGNASTATSFTGLAQVPSGGTGQTSLTLNNLAVGNGQFAVKGIAPGAAGTILGSTVYGSASFTAGISSGVLTVATGTLTGTLTEGATIVGVAITTGTTINQLTSSASAVATPTFVSGGAIGSYQVTVSSATGLVAGQLVTGTGIPNNTFLQSFNGTTLTLTRAFTVQSAGTLNFYTPGGVGTYQTTPSQTVSTGTAMTATNGTYWAPVNSTTYINGQAFTSSGTFTIPTGVIGLKATYVGGGGGAGGSQGGDCGFGGGYGGSSPIGVKYFNSLTPGQTLSVTIGTGGSGGGGGYNSGGYAGGTTTISGTTAVFLGSISGTALTVTSITSGTIAIGQAITGTGVTAGTTISSGSGLSWVVSASQTVPNTTITSSISATSTGGGGGASAGAGGGNGASGTLTNQTFQTPYFPITGISGGGGVSGGGGGAGGVLLEW